MKATIMLAAFLGLGMVYLFDLVPPDAVGDDRGAAIDELNNSCADTNSC